MKKFFKIKTIVLIILILFSIIITALYLNPDRYKINSPMMDLEYKKSIIKTSLNPFYKLENLRPLMGEEELGEFIKKNNSNALIYTPSSENRKSGRFRANLHNHTTNSDGQMTVTELLDKAQAYAQSYIKDDYMVIGITDHNTVLGAKEIIKVLEKYPNRYPNLKIVAGIEIFSAYKNSKYSPAEDVQIHVLSWCINPYDRYLNKEFYKRDKKDKYNRGKEDRDFDTLIHTMSKYSLVGIAHPARYLTDIKEEDRILYIEEMLDRYLKQTTKIPFIEGYYQSYSDDGIKKFEGLEDLSYELYKIISEHKELKGKIYGKRFEIFLKNINNIADKKGIIKTGSTDSHGLSIFRAR